MASMPLTHAPLDEHNRALLDNVRPAAWINPEPAARYNLVVVGAGTAGLVTAAGAAILGAKVALVEREFMGGDCLNFGCVPSKALIRCARAAAAVRDAKRFGVEVAGEVRIDFAAVMERMRALRAHLSRTDSAARFRELGVDVFIGDARFVAPDAVEAGGKRLRFRHAVIASGARAAALPIPGLADVGALTNETVFSLTSLPRRLAVIGGGPIGCELAQAFRRLGAEVTVLEVMPQILIREDRDAAQRIERALRRDGVDIITECKIVRAERRGADKVLAIEHGGAAREVIADEILAGVGRVPAVDGLNLEAARVAYDRQNGIKVDDFLRTTNPLIYAAGDVASGLKFTHLSDAHARIVLRNALFMGRRRVSALTIPWVTYTDPEIAHVGLYEADARGRGIQVETFVQELAEVDRAVLDGDEDGFVKVHVRKGTDRIVGATIVANHAGEMISELTAALASGIGLGALSEVIHPYPTEADAIRRTGFLYSRTRLTPTVAGLMRRWFALTR